MKVIFWKANLITCDAMHISDLILKIAPQAKPKIINFGIDTNFFNFKDEYSGLLKAGGAKIISDINDLFILNYLMTLY